MKQFNFETARCSETTDRSLKLGQIFHNSDSFSYL